MISHDHSLAPELLLCASQIATTGRFHKSSSRLHDAIHTKSESPRRVTSSSARVPIDTEESMSPSSRSTNLVSIDSKQKNHDNENKEKQSRFYKLVLDRWLAPKTIATDYPYFQEKSWPASLGEEALPNELIYAKVDGLKKGYLDPDALIERLSTLKPSENYEVRTPPYPRDRWLTRDASPHPEARPGGFAWRIRWGSLMAHDLAAAAFRYKADERMKRIMDTRLEVPLPKLPWSYWNESDSEFPPIPRWVSNGLFEIEKAANWKGTRAYGAAAKAATQARKALLQQFDSEQRDRRLIDEPVCFYNKWPSELVQAVDDIEVAAVQKGRKAHVEALTEAVQQMHRLVEFWISCGRPAGANKESPSWWTWDERCSIEGFAWPTRLRAQLEELQLKKSERQFRAELGRDILIAVVYWKAMILDTGKEPPTNLDDPVLFSKLHEKLTSTWERNDHFEDSLIRMVRDRRLELQSQETSPKKSRKRKSEVELLHEASKIMRREEHTAINPVRRRRTRQTPNDRVSEDNVWSGRLRARKCPA